MEALGNNADKESFIRWQGRTIEQLGYVNNLFLLFSVSLFAFQYEFISELKEPLPHIEASVFWYGIFFNIISFSSGVISTINRVCDFRLTARIARRREKKVASEELACSRCFSKIMGKVTWLLIYTQVITLGICMILSISLIWNHFNQNL